MAEAAKVKVAIQLDEEEYKKLVANMQQLEQEVTKFEKTTGPNAPTQQERMWAETQKQVEIADEKLNQFLITARAAGKEQEFLNTLVTKGEKEAISQLQKMLGLKAQDNAMTKEQIKLINLRASELRHESIAIRRGAMDLRLFSEAAIITGTAVIVSMTMMAKKFSDAFKEGNVDAARYTATMHSLEIAQNRVGQQFSKALIPFIQEATKVIDRAGKFLQAHPEVATAAIKGAEILIGVGLVGRSVAMAARLTADFLAIQSSILRLIAARAQEAANAETELAAAELQNVAADKQLEAAGIQTQASGTGAVTRGTGLAATASTFLGSAGGVGIMAVVSGFLAKGISDNFDKLKDALNEQKDGVGTAVRFLAAQIATQLPGGKFIALVENSKAMASFLQKILGQFEKQEDARTRMQPAGRMDIASAPPGSVVTSKNLEQMLDAYDKYITDIQKLTMDHYDKLKSITQDALDAIEKENRRYADAVEKVNTGLAKSLAKLSTDYQKQSAKDELKYQRDRKKVQDDANDDILKMQQDLKDKLAKLERESWFRQQDLIAARDALGLVKERRRLAEQELEAKQDAAKEIARRREDIAQRLAEIDQEYAEQKAQRLADYLARVEEEKQQAKERLAELAINHQEELKQIREQAAEKLREEQIHFNTERTRLYNQFIQRLRDIDAFYLGEINLERSRRATMIADLDAFLTTYRNKTLAMYNSVAAGTTGTGTGTTGTRTGTRAFGGYAPYGNYILGDRGGGGKGPDEFVLDGSTTKAAEALIGGKLSQQSILDAMMAKKTIGNTIVWNDQRRFDSKLSPADRRMITEDTKRTIQEMLA